MVLANFYQNRFFRNRHPTSFTICLSLPSWRLYSSLSTIFLVTTIPLIPQLYIFHFGSCSFLYLEPFYITSPDRGLWWGPSPQPWCTQTPWMCFLCLNSTLPQILSHLLCQYALSAFLMVSTTLPQDTKLTPHLATQCRPAHSRTSIPDCLWLHLIPVEASSESIWKEEWFSLRERVINFLYLFPPAGEGGIFLRNPEANTAGLHYESLSFESHLDWCLWRPCSLPTLNLGSNCS